MAKIDGRRQTADDSRQTTDGRRQTPDGRRQTADGRRQKIEQNKKNLILADVRDFGQKKFSLKMNYLGFKWPLRDVFSSRELTSASNEHHIDP